MLTSPITNDHFHTRVLSLLNSYTQSLSGSSQAQPLPLIPALDNPDTPLGPSDTIGQLVTFTSSWIDLSSPDPVIEHLSRQVFHLEIAYAAFCGATNIVVPGPRLSNGQTGVSQFARSIKEALAAASYVQLHVQLPMDGKSSTSYEDDMGDLARFARPEFEPSKHAKNLNSWSSWDAWNTIRSISKYHNRLSVGTTAIPPYFNGSHCSPSKGILTKQSQFWISHGDSLHWHSSHAGTLKTSVCSTFPPRPSSSTLVNHLYCQKRIKSLSSDACAYSVVPGYFFQMWASSQELRIQM